MGFNSAFKGLRETVFSVPYDQVLYVIEMNVNIQCINPLNPELNPICYLLALLGAHHFLHVSRIRVNLTSLTLLHVLLEILFFLVTTVAYNTRFFFMCSRTCVSIP